MQTKLRHLAALGAVAVAVVGLGACNSGGTTGTAASTVTTGPPATGTPGATFAKLRSELAKYHPSDQVVDQIVASLTLQ